MHSLNQISSLFIIFFFLDNEWEAQHRREEEIVELDTGVSDWFCALSLTATWMLTAADAWVDREKVWENEATAYTFILMQPYAPTVFDKKICIILFKTEAKKVRFGVSSLGSSSFE